MPDTHGERAAADVQSRAMPRLSAKPHPLTTSEAKRIWLHAQQLTTPAPFGDGAAATRAAVEHLGYVQIDTINVIERCHHHILWSRIPSYRRGHLHQARDFGAGAAEYADPDGGPRVHG